MSNDTTPTLDDLNITRDQLSRWQKLAAILDGAGLGVPAFTPV